MKWCYHPGYQAPLSAVHPFPMSKYPLLKERLLAEGVLVAADGLEPEAIPIAWAARVHTAEYLNKLEQLRAVGRRGPPARTALERGAVVAVAARRGRDVARGAHGAA